MQPQHPSFASFCSASFASPAFLLQSLHAFPYNIPPLFSRPSIRNTIRRGTRTCSIPDFVLFVGRDIFFIFFEQVEQQRAVPRTRKNESFCTSVKEVPRVLSCTRAVSMAMEKGVYTKIHAHTTRPPQNVLDGVWELGGEVYGPPAHLNTAKEGPPVLRTPPTSRARGRGK